MSERLRKSDWLKECARLLRAHGFQAQYAGEYADALWRSVTRSDGVFYEKGAQMTPADAVASDRECWES